MALTLDSDGAISSQSDRPDARLITVDRSGTVVTDRNVPGSGTSQLNIQDSTIRWTGSTGVWSQNSKDAPDQPMNLPQMQTHMFTIGSSMVVLSNVGFGKSGYEYALKNSHTGTGGAANHTVPALVGSAGQCGKKILIRATTPSGGLRERRFAYLYDPQTDSLKQVASWSPEKPSSDSYMSYAPCDSDGAIYSMSSYYAKGRETESPVGTSLEKVTIDGKHSTIDCKTQDGKIFLGESLANRHTVALLGGQVYWVASTKDLKRQFVYRTNPDDGVTSEIVELTLPGTAPRQQIASISGQHVITMDYPSGGGDLLITVRRLKDGAITYGPLAVKGLNVNDFGMSSPIMALLTPQSNPS